jgi:phosphatidylinositol alpha-1,6-mannosyltransferase
MRPIGTETSSRTGSAKRSRPSRPNADTPRALILTPDFPPAPGGIQLLVHRLASNLTGLAPDVVAQGVPGDEKVDEAAPFPVRRVARKGQSNKLAVAQLNLAGLARGLRRPRPAVVISGHVVTWPGAAAVRRLTGAPVIQYLHADETRKRPGLTARAMRGADGVVAVSTHARELAIAAGAAAERVWLVNPGVDTPAPVDREPARHPTIVTVSRIDEEYKGHDSVARALPAVRERVPDARWVVIGDGRLRERLERIVAESGVGDAVELHGAVDDAERDRLVASASVFCLPSRPPTGGGGEGFGIVYLEAASRGLPVVACASGGALDAVADGETGVLVPPGDDAALADVLAGLLADPERAQALGEAGRRRAAGFTWKRHGAAVDELAAELIGRR